MSAAPAATNHTVPAGLITHCTVLIRGHHNADITCYHAGCTDARITLVWGGTMIVLYSADAAHGLLEAFVTARAATARLPRLLAPPVGRDESPFARTTVSMGIHPPTHLCRRPAQRARPHRGPHHPLGRPTHRAHHLADPRPRRPDKRHRDPAPRLHLSDRSVPRRRPAPKRPHHRRPRRRLTSATAAGQVPRGPGRFALATNRAPHRPACPPQ